MIINKLLQLFKYKYLSTKLKEVGKNFKADKGLVLIGPQYITVEDDFSAGRNLYLQAWDRYDGKILNSTPNLVIGNNVSVMSNCQISCAKEVIIKDGTLLGDNVFITDNFHGDNSLKELMISPLKRPLYVKGKVYIGKNVWIGRNVCIMPGTSIGDGAVIGANAVVTRNIPPYSIAVGNPARVIKKVK